jgi:hypothetical protein
MNSLPLSESMPKMGNGNRANSSSKAANTHFWALLRTVWFSVHPVAISVTVRVKQCSPSSDPPSWPTRSISTNPGRLSSQSAQVRIGIWDFSNDPGLVWDRPRTVNRARSTASRRSMVAALMPISSSAWASVIFSSWSRRSIGTRIGSIGASRFPDGARSTAQHSTSAATTSAA